MVRHVIVANLVLYASGSVVHLLENSLRSLLFHCERLDIKFLPEQR